MDWNGKIGRAEFVAFGLIAIAVVGTIVSPAALAERHVVDDRIVVTFPDQTSNAQREAIRKSITQADEEIRSRFELARRHYSIAIVAHKAGGLSEGWRSSITIPTDFLSAWGHGVIWHEIAHTYTARPQDFLSRSTYRLPHFYVEGLAVWVENRLGPGDIDLHRTVSNRGWHRVSPVTRTILEFDHDNARGTRSMHYAIAGSFVQFLIDEILGGDIAKFQNFYRGHQNDYTKHFGKSFRALADEWLVFVAAIAGS